MVPDRLGKYELRGTLGKGAMGVVYDAWDPVIERRVAVKTIRLPADGDEAAEEEYARFKREAQAAGRLSHPGIVGVYDYGDTDGIAYIAMELVEGQSLKAMMDAEQRLTPDAAVRVMRELLDALAYSHARGVIHRDIKPTNILVTAKGAIKITDFGIARIESSSMTQMGTVMGTPAYMSPEQFMGQTVDQRTDIYAAGVLLFQLLTGERPFEGGLTAIMHKVLHTTPPKPSDLSVTAPAAFDAVVACAMARRPEDRYPTAEAFSAALTAALAGGPAPLPYGGEDATLVVSPRSAPVPQPPPAAPPVTQAARVKAPPKRTPLALIGAAALAVLVLAGGGAFWLLRSGGESSVSAPATALASVTLIPPATPPVPIAPPAVAPASVSPAPAAVVPPASPPPASSPPAPSPPRVSPPPAAAVPASVTPAAPQPVLPPPVSPPPAPNPPLSASASPPSAASPSPPSSAPVVPPLVQAPPQVAAPSMAPPQTATADLAPAPVSPPAASQASEPATAMQAVRNVGCTLLEANTGPDNRTVVTGLSGTGAPDTAARAALTAIGVRANALDWRATRFDGPYCGVVDALRDIRNAQNGTGPAGFDLSLRGGRTRLRNGEIMAPIITAPAFPAHMQLAYFQSDRTVVHLFPSAGVPDRLLPPGAVVPVGDPRTGGWGVGDPFGTDMMVAIMSSEPLPARLEDEQADTYLAALSRAADQVIHNGGTILFRSVFIQTTR